MRIYQEIKPPKKWLLCDILLFSKSCWTLTILYTKCSFLAGLESNKNCPFLFGIKYRFLLVNHISTLQGHLDRILSFLEYLQKIWNIFKSPSHKLKWLLLNNRVLWSHLEMFIYLIFNIFDKARFCKICREASNQETINLFTVSSVSSL